MSDVPDDIRAGQAHLERVRAEHERTKAEAAPPRMALGIDFAAIMRGAPPEAPKPKPVIDPRVRAEATRRARELAHGRVSAMPVPRDLVDRIVDDQLEARQALHAVKEWRSVQREGGARPTLVLLSGVRAGKTVAAAWLVARVSRAQYWKLAKLCQVAKSNFGPDQLKFEEALRAPLLVVDELSAELDHDQGRATLQDVIDERQPRDLATILIANRTRTELFERYDPRTVRRLLESATFVECADPSASRQTRLGERR